jgi:hypothetical protein
MPWRQPDEKQDVNNGGGVMFGRWRLPHVNYQRSSRDPSCVARYH